MTAHRRTRFARRWAWPIILALLTFLGLALAFVGGGVWLLVMWLSLGMPLAVIAWFVVRADRKPPDTRRSYQKAL